MKKFFLTAALAVAVASPAFAASTHHARNNAAAHETYAQDGYAYMPDSMTVVSDGKVIGRDPDAFIRQSLLREGDHTNEQGAGN